MPRRADSADLTAIATLYHHVWHETHAYFMPDEERQRRTLGFFVDRMRSLLPTTLVADGDTALAGFVAWQANVLSQLFVDASHRGTGLAYTLLASAEAAMATNGIIEAELHCVVGNDRARQFYERNGWITHETTTEPVNGPNGYVPLAFWRMVKRLNA